MSSGSEIDEHAAEESRPASAFDEPSAKVKRRNLITALILLAFILFSVGLHIYLRVTAG